jgi:hypothetical protein
VFRRALDRLAAAVFPAVALVAASPAAVADRTAVVVEALAADTVNPVQSRQKKGRRGENLTGLFYFRRRYPAYASPLHTRFHSHPHPVWKRARSICDAKRAISGVRIQLFP